MDARNWIDPGIQRMFSDWPKLFMGLFLKSHNVLTQPGSDRSWRLAGQLRKKSLSFRKARTRYLRRTRRTSPCTFFPRLSVCERTGRVRAVQATIADYFKGLHKFASLVNSLGLNKPKRAVIQMLSLIQGAIVMAQSTRDPAIVEANHDATRLFLEDGLASSSEAKKKVDNA